MSWWFAAAAGAQAIGALVQANSQMKQNQSQRAVNRYNAMMAYNTEMNNISSSLAIAGVNAALAGKAASMNMQLARFNASQIRQVAQYNNALIRRSTEYNSQLLNATIDYNNSLIDEEISDLWEAADLDVALLANQRARERGTAVAIQAGSGTVIGEGSNADVIMDSMTQEALDAFVIRHQADRQTEAYRREQAKNVYMGRLEMNRMLWEGQVQQQKNSYEAEVQARSTIANAGVQSMNMIGQAAANLASTQIAARAGRYSARQGLQANMWNANMSYKQNQYQIQGNMLASLFGAGSTYLMGQAQTKPVQQNTYNISYGNVLANRSTGIGYTGMGEPYVITQDISYPGTSTLAAPSTFGASYK